MEHSDIEHMAQGYPPARIGKDSGEVLAWLASQLLATQEQRDALAAENANIKIMNDVLSEELRGYESDGAYDGPIAHKLWHSNSETPATDDYLNSVRAEGVDKAIEHLHEKFSSTGHIGVPVMALEWLSTQLRAGKDGE